MEGSGMIRTGYIAQWNKLKEKYPAATFLRVCRPSILGPSKQLLFFVKKLEKETDSRMDAWVQSNYEERYRQEIMSNEKALELMKFIKRNYSGEDDIFLMCYEKDFPCHRFILKDMIEKIGDDNIG